MRRPDIHATITALRTTRNMTIEQVAERVGITPSVVERCEHPRHSRKVPLSQVCLVCDALGVHPSQVLGWPRHLATPAVSP